MTKNEILYNVGLTEKVYSEQKDIDFKAQRLKLIKWIDDKKTDTQGFVATKDKSIYIVGEEVLLKRIFKTMHQLIKFHLFKMVKKFTLDLNHLGTLLKTKLINH